MLAAAYVAGVTRAFTIGGAQAVAALAYGTATVPKVDKITGPGNAYVASAKKRVFGTVGIDMIAGPSEILVLADGSTPADWVAMDLFSQAEHDELAQSILLCPDAAYIDAVQAAIDRLLPTMPRAEIIAFEGAFHGRSTGAIAAAGSEKMTKGYGPLMPGFRQLPFGDHAALKAAITDQTDGWASLTLTGPHATDALARLVPLDLRPAAFPVGQTTRSALNHMQMILTRTAPDAFHILVFRSMARTAWHELHEALTTLHARAQTL